MDTLCPKKVCTFGFIALTYMTDFDDFFAEMLLLVIRFSHFT